MPGPKLSQHILLAAIEGFESQKLRIDVQIAELRQMLTGAPNEAAATPEAPTTKRRMSAAARKRIGDAQRKRWAESKEESEPDPKESPKPKRRLSKAGRANIIAALKKRWAAKKAAKTKPKPVAAKKSAAKKVAVKKAPVKAARKAAKKVAAKRRQKTATTPTVPVATA